MKMHSSVEALYALIFAICVLVALFLLTSCGAREASVPEAPLERDLVLPTLYRSVAADIRTREEEVEALE